MDTFFLKEEFKLAKTRGDLTPDPCIYFIYSPETDTFMPVVNGVGILFKHLEAKDG